MRSTSLSCRVVPEKNVSAQNFDLAKSWSTSEDENSEAQDLLKNLRDKSLIQELIEKRFSVACGFRKLAKFSQSVFIFYAQGCSKTRGGL